MKRLHFTLPKHYWMLLKRRLLRYEIMIIIRLLLPTQLPYSFKLKRGISRILIVSKSIARVLSAES